MRPQSCASWMFALSLCAWLGAACEKTEEQPGGTAAAPEQAVPAPSKAPAVKATPTPPPSARVFFIEPVAGAQVTGPAVDGKVAVTVKMGAENIAVEAAGAQVQGAGHHHLIVDGAFVAMGAVVPKDETHVHYGQGQTEARVMLAPGDHTLTLQLADGAHVSYGPQLSAEIKVKVAAAR